MVTVHLFSQREGVDRGDYLFLLLLLCAYLTTPYKSSNAFSVLPTRSNLVLRDAIPQ
ncbi:hypothetical protein CCP3SC1_220010 [Gammaproteobacteria bacterium]